MADCSKTEVFLAEWNRMCESVVICDDCYMRNLVDGMKCTSKSLCMLAVLRSKEEAIKIVQEWSDNNPPEPSGWMVNIIQCRGKDYYFLCRDLGYGKLEYLPQPYGDKASAMRECNRLNRKENDDG